MTNRAYRLTENVSTLAEVSREKPKHTENQGKGRYAKGVAYKCRIGRHNECFSMTCACACGHRSTP